MTDIYLITNHAVSPNMYYVGRTDGDLDKRFVEHVRLASR
jgi:predicted GIY-YIG superfamily endonuclease